MYDLNTIIKMNKPKKDKGNDMDTEFISGRDLGDENTGDGNNNKYWATISWDGYSDDTMGDQTILRYKMDHLLEDVDYYLKKFKDRDAYLSSASHEFYGECADITEAVKSYLINKRG